MKKIVGGMLILLLSVAIFAADKTIITTRDKLEKILEKKVFLELFVKVLSPFKPK